MVPMSENDRKYGEWEKRAASAALDGMGRTGRQKHAVSATVDGRDRTDGHLCTTWKMAKDRSSGRTLRQ